MTSWSIALTRPSRNQTGFTTKSPRHQVLFTFFPSLCLCAFVVDFRVSVQFLDQQGLPVTYVFDVFHRDGSYWGAAMGYPRRHWVLRDVYLRDEEPLFWRLVYEPKVRHLSWPPEP